MKKPIVTDEYALTTEDLVAPPGDYVVDKRDDEVQDYHYLRSVAVAGGSEDNT